MKATIGGLRFDPAEIRRIAARCSVKTVVPTEAAIRRREIEAKQAATMDAMLNRGCTYAQLTELFPGKWEAIAEAERRTGRKAVRPDIAARPDDNEIVATYKRLKSCNRTARELGQSVRRVLAVVRNAGLFNDARGNRTSDAEMLAEVVGWIEAGVSRIEICKRLGVRKRSRVLARAQKKCGKIARSYTTTCTYSPEQMEQLYRQHGCDKLKTAQATGVHPFTIEAMMKKRGVVNEKILYATSA